LVSLIKNKEHTVAKAKVLLVEDDPLQAEATKKLLIKSGYDVLWAGDGINAIKMTKLHIPDIILLDLMLPGLDGHEVCRWVKVEESTKGIPVIMLTAKKDIADKVAGLHGGADDFLPKPYNELELNARIYSSLRTKALQDELRAKNRELEAVLLKVEHMATVDVLTGLFNRRRFHEVLSNEFERSRRFDTPFSLIMADIDHFKQINDNYGHQTGDSVLREIALLLTRNIREIDTASRYGGEEFMIILPNTQKASAKVVAERMRAEAEKHTFAGIEKDGLTVSFGYSGMPDSHIKDEEYLIRCVDHALYSAKQNGRNRVELFEGHDLENLKTR
jgi:diguanylate cyclase (GGDEF)-like protein